jgi:FkbM family methyltransferase
MSPIETSRDFAFLQRYAVENVHGGDREGYAFYCLGGEEFIGERLRGGALFEDQSIRTISRLLEPESVVLDVGAHIGLYSVALGKQLTRGHVYAFEPQPMLFTLLSLNLLENRVPHYDIYNTAIAARLSTATMQRAVADGKGAGRAVDYRTDDQYNFGGLAIGRGGQLTTTIALDDFVDKMRLSRVDLLKVDVEGAEPFVFYGARRTIKRHRPIIHFERNRKRVTAAMTKALGERPGGRAATFDVLAYLATLGYEGYEMPFHNVLGVPKERRQPEGE